MARTLDEWLSFLTSQMDKRSETITLLRDYTTGNARLPEMGPNLRKAWREFQRRSRSNAAAMIVDALAERLVPNGLTVGNVDSPATRAASRIWRDNRLDVGVADAIADAVTLGCGYLLVSQDEDGHAVITRENPEVMYVEPDPVRPWRALAAIKVWRDMPAKTDYLVMWAGGLCVTYTRDAFDHDRLLRRVSGQWTLQTGSISTYDGAVPVVILENKNSRGEFQNHLDLIDRINWQILQRLVIIAMQAFRQRALRQSETSPGVPTEDEQGNEVDYQKLFEPGPGALWELPPGVEIWESQVTDINQILTAVKDDWRELAASTKTPLSIMLPDAANQSASGAEAPQKSLVDKARDRINRFKPALAVMMVKALQVEGVELEDGQTVEVLFEPPHAVSMTEKYASAKMAREAGESLETIQRNILGYSPEQVAQDKQRRSEEQMAQALLLTAQTAGTPTQGEQEAAPEPVGAP